MPETRTNTCLMVEKRRI